MRLFIEARLPQSAVTEAARMSAQLRRRLTGRDGDGDAVRWVRPEAIHLTLRFLGEIEPERPPAIQTAMTEAAAAQAGAGTKAGPISLRLGEAGVFGGRRPRVLWLGVEGELARLHDLAQRLDADLAAAGVGARPGAPWPPSQRQSRPRPASPGAAWTPQ